MVSLPMENGNGIGKMTATSLAFEKSEHTSTVSERCQVCGLKEWLPLPDPVADHAVTTAGRIIHESLGKSQCAHCGFVQRTNARFLGHTDYYEQDYAKYYDRPGTRQFHVARYRVLAEWMESVLRPITPSRILDAGCGQGWAMEAMLSIYPKAVIEGVEPSTFNAQIAREKGFSVHEGRVETMASPDTKYDLVYSNNVIQHATNAREFIASLQQMVTDEGVVIITCPDGSTANIEILWGDQNFSFLPAHLICLCSEFGFENISWFPSPASSALPPAQLVRISKTGNPGGGVRVNAPALESIYLARCEYLNSFKDIDSYLCAQTDSRGPIFNFGASYWSSILSAYCPRYWKRVMACVVEGLDNADGGFLGKEVLELGAVSPKEDAVIVLGTSPSTHDALRRKLSPEWKHVITWNQFPPQY